MFLQSLQPVVQLYQRKAPATPEGVVRYCAEGVWGDEGTQSRIVETHLSDYFQLAVVFKRHFCELFTFFEHFARKRSDPTRNCDAFEPAPLEAALSERVH